MKDFKYWENLYKKQELEQFSTNKEGLLWLKLKSIVRVELLKGFVKSANIDINLTTQNQNFQNLYNELILDLDKSHHKLDKYILYIYDTIRANIDIEKITSELYKLQSFSWGGDYQNSLDKYLISKYIKIPNPSYNDLVSNFDTTINAAVQGYVLNSWYNYWSSVLIENIFKAHPSVLPAIGLIKSVDFFIKEIPFDLKVTYFPAEYMKQKRREKGLPAELTYLKQKAKALKIPFDNNAKPNEIHYEISEKLRNSQNHSILEKIKEENVLILNEAVSNPKELAIWLYENQGEMRFGAENRIYLILVDQNEMSNSWKLKRNTGVLKDVINTYLDNFDSSKIEELQLSFRYKNKTSSFNTIADVIFVKQ